MGLRISRRRVRYGLSCFGYTCRRLIDLSLIAGTEQPPTVEQSGAVSWVREGMHVSDYVSVYVQGAGRQIRLEFISHNANKTAAELVTLGHDQLAVNHRRIELEACKILMDDLKQACQTMARLYETYLEADVVFTVAKDLYRVSFQWKNPGFLLKNVDFLLKTVDLII